MAKLHQVPKLRTGLLLFLCLGSPLFVYANSARADEAPSWQINSISNSTVAPGQQFDYEMEIKNPSTTNSEGGLKVTVTLPEGFTGVEAKIDEGLNISCPNIAGATVIECVGSSEWFLSHGAQTFALTVAVSPDASGVLTTAFEIDAKPLAPGHTVDPILVTPVPAEFGFDTLDFGLADAAGGRFDQAAAHPAALTTTIDFNTHSDPNVVAGEADPVEDVKDVEVGLPPGLVGNPAILGECDAAQLINGGIGPLALCPTNSQVGVAFVKLGNGDGAIDVGPIPVYNMVPPPGVPARFGFDAGGPVVILDAHVRSSGDYGISIVDHDVPAAVPVSGSTVTFWGVPSDSAHTPQRACPGFSYPIAEGVPSCPSEEPPAGFLRTPAACTSPGVGLPLSARIDSWADPGDFKEASIATHQNPGYPYAREVWGPPIGIEGCGKVPFEPTISTDLTTTKADSPTGLSVDLGLPSDCWASKATVEEAEASLCQSDMKEVSITLPQGLSLNAAAAGGRTSCTPGQIGLTTSFGSSPIHFDESSAACPNASKIGTVEIETPVLGRHDDEGNPVTDEAGNPVLVPLKGSVYLAQQQQNPFGSLLAIYLVAEGSGILVKQAGEISLSSAGQVTTTFDQVPQTPVSNIHLELFGGPGAALRTPSGCGTYTTQATLVPWSGTGAVERQSSFQITQGCGNGFDPKLDAGTENPLAGTYSPFNLRLSREDGTQELGGLQVKLPPGLVSSLRGYSYCPDSVLAAISSEPGTGAAQEASPSCPASSHVGSVTVGAGAGANPFYTSSGKAYLAGPYKGAPVSLAVVAPAVAGPFDLGSVVVRNAIHIEPRTAQLTIDSDPLPSVLHGVPLDLRDVRVRYDHTLNPTDCEPMQVESTVTSTQGATASPSVHFQVAGCDRLGFKPKLSLRFSGPTHRAAHPALHAVLKARPGDANLASTTVLLPKTELLENAHIRNVCTRVQYNAGAGGGAGCPKGSVYGYAKAWTPLLDQPLQGPVYLRSNGGERELPDLVASLGGQIHVDLVGYVDSVHARIRNRFAIVPDAPVSKFELTMFGAKKGLLANETELCKAKPRASLFINAQNGRVEQSQPLVGLGCGKGSTRKRHKRH